MRRRDLLASLGGLAAFGTAGWYALGDGGGGVEPATSDGSATGSGEPDGIAPVTIETLDAQHSEAGTMTVPATGTVTVIDVFATWCAACDDQLRSLATAHDQVGDDAQFVSVTNEAIGGGLTREDIRTFWRDHAGRWPVGLDDDGQLTSRLDVQGLPHTAVTGPAGRVVYAERGVTSPDDVVSAVEEASTR